MVVALMLVLLPQRPASAYYYRGAGYGSEAGSNVGLLIAGGVLVVGLGFAVGLAIFGSAHEPPPPPVVVMPPPYYPPPPPPPPIAYPP